MGQKDEERKVETLPYQYQSQSNFALYAEKSNSHYFSPKKRFGSCSSIVTFRALDWPIFVLVWWPRKKIRRGKDETTQSD